LAGLFLCAHALTRTRASYLVLLALALGAPRPAGAAVPSGTDDLTPDGLANLVAFARAFGPIRFFHPSDQAASAPWEEVAIAGADRLESARSGAELAGGLSSLFSPYAPTAAFLSGGAPAAHRGVPNGANHVVRWRHHGFAFGTDPILENIYFARREAGPPGRREPSATLELGRGVRLVLPLAVWGDATGATLPLASATSRVVSSASPSRTARASRLATVVLAWTAVRYFHPHLRDGGVDWDRELVTALQGAATAKGRRELLVVLKAMMAALHDGHAGATLFEGPENVDGRPPITLATVGDQLVVARGSGAVGASLPPGSAGSDDRWGGVILVNAGR
jgi:hypothetical protein